MKPPKRRKASQTVEQIPFYDKDGKRRLSLPGNLTVGQMTAMGIRVALVPKGSAIKKNALIHPKP